MRVALTGMPLAAALAGCKPPAFAEHESELASAPPAALTEQAGFWNDPASGSFGEISFAPGLYRYGSQSCRPARRTVLNSTGQELSDTYLLYCQSSNGAWTLQPSVICRPTTASGGLACRDPDGTWLTMPPV